MSSCQINPQLFQKLEIIYLGWFSAGSALAGGLLAGPIGLLAGCIGSKKLEPYCLECGSGAVTDQPPMGLGAHWLAFWLIAGGLLLLAVLALLE